MRLHGMADALKTQEQDPAARRTELPGAPGAAGRSPMELAPEPGAGTTTARGQAARQRLRRRDRLSCGARTGQERDPRAGAGVGMGAQSRTHLRSRTDRRRQELRCLRTGAEGLPRWVLRALHARRGAVPRSGDRACRWQPAPAAGQAQPHRCAGDRRLGHGTAHRNRSAATSGRSAKTAIRPDR